MRIPRALALFMLAFLALPSPVAAQTTITEGDISIVLQSVSIDGMEVRDLTDADIATRGYNGEECDARATVTSVFRVTNVPSGITFVDVWLGDPGVDCATVEARQSGDQRDCAHLSGVDPNIGLDGNITLTLTEMLDPDDDACETGTATGRKLLLWLFAADSPETTAAVTTAQYGWLEFTVDPNAPTTPTPDESTANGDASVPLEWSVGTEANLRYNVYVDTSVGACGDVGAWTPGGPPPEGATPIEVTSNSTNFSAAGLAYDQSVLVHITALDLADNESNLSTAICITRVQTVGFCDALEDGGEPCTNTCAATLPGTRTASGALWLGLAFLALVVRRRTR